MSLLTVLLVASVFGLTLAGTRETNPVKPGYTQYGGTNVSENLFSQSNITGRTAIPFDIFRWPNATIPYIIAAELDKGKDIIQSAFDDYQTKTCIRFVQRTTQRNYIKIFEGDGCFAAIGMLGEGEQPVSVGKGCLQRGSIIHDLGHSVGFYNEHNRSDRDDFLIIFWNNIQQGMADQFQKLTPAQNLLFNTFDEKSIMMYGSTFFSKDGRSKTMSAKSGNVLEEVYNKPGLSPSDVKRVKQLYRC